MKVGFYTYNTPSVQYQTPVFTARPIKVKWNSESGKLIEKTLLAFSTAAAAEYNVQLSNLNREMIPIRTYDKDGNIVEKEVEKSVLEKDPKKLFEENKDILEETYKITKDPNIVEKHAQLYKDALKNKDILKGGFSELTDKDIEDVVITDNVITALDTLGKGNLEAAFGFDICGFRNFCFDIYRMVCNISEKNLEILKKKINPSSTNEYKNLEEEIRKDKRKINKLLGHENSIKRKEILEKIEGLKEDKNNQVQIKELKRELQNLYRNCENSDEIWEVMNSISEKQRKMKEILAQKIDLSPQEIIKKVWTIAAISQSDIYKKEDLDITPETIKIWKEIALNYDNFDENTVLSEEDEEILRETYAIKKRKLNKDIKELIELIQPNSTKNEEAWRKNLDKKLYDRAGFTYTKYLSELFNLSDCKYLNELVVSSEDFWDSMNLLIDLTGPYTAKEKDYEMDVRLDSLDHNLITWVDFYKHDINYQRWALYNPHLNIKDKVTLKAEDAKNNAVKNMVYELTNQTYLKQIPKTEREKLYSTLKENDIDVDVKSKKVTINGKNIEYSDLGKVLSVIKSELNTNPFWSEEHENERIDYARDTIYNHFMLQRKHEIDNAKNLKDEEVIDIKVQKVNMSDIKHSLCLGNHAHCCTALGCQTNEWSAPLYVLSRCISAIEVLADGEPVGNTMMYMAEVNGKLSLVLDDIELQTKFQNNNKIRDMIIKCAKEVCSWVEQPDIPIYAGPGMHKVDMSRYKIVEDAEMKILGKTPKKGGVYLDFDQDQHDIGDITEICDLYRLA